MLPKPLLLFVTLLGTSLKFPLLYNCLFGAEQPCSRLLNLNRLKLQQRLKLALAKSWALTGLRTIPSIRSTMFLLFLLS